MAGENNIDVEKLLEALNINANMAADALGKFGNETDLATEKLQGTDKATRAVQKELDGLGLILKKTVAVKDAEYTTLKKSEEQLKKRQKLDADTNKLLEETQENYKSLSDAQKEEYKAKLRSNNLLDQQLESMNRVLNENGKLVDLTVRLTKADLLKLNAIQREEAAIKKHEQAIVGAANALFDLPKQLGLVALKYAFDRLIGGIDAAYKGMVLYETALIEGKTDEVTMGIKRRESMKAEADAAGNAGDSLKGLGATLAGLGATLIGFAFRAEIAAAAMAALETLAAGIASAAAIISAPVALVAGAAVALVAAIGGLVWWFGRGQEQTKKSIEYQIQRDEELGKQNKTLFEGYEKLSSATLVGSRGLQGMFDDLQKVGLTVSQFEKLNKVLQENQKDMRLFGAGAIDGAKNFAEQAGKLVKDDLGKELFAMGISQEEQMSHMANFMSMQAKMGIKTSGDQTKAAANYIKELDKMALLTGQTRKEQEDARKAIMAINQLRAAQMMAEKRGDKEGAARLGRYADAAVTTQAIDPEMAAAIAKYAAGGVTSAETAQFYQTAGGKGGTIEMLDKGVGSRAERDQQLTKDVMAQEERFGDVTAITGGTAGLTVGEGKLDKWMTKAAGDNTIAEAAKNAGMSIDEYAASQRKVADDAKKAADARLAEQEKGLAADKALREGRMTAERSMEMQAEATESWWSNFVKGMDKWWTKFTADLTTWWEEFKKAPTKYLNELWDELGKLPTKILTEFTGLVDNIGKAFANMITKIIDLIPGVKTVVDATKSAASSVGDAASSAYNGVTGFFSPSSGGSKGGQGGASAPAAPAAHGGSGRGGQGGAPVPAAAPAKPSSGFTGPPGGGPVGSGWTGGSAPAQRSSMSPDSSATIPSSASQAVLDYIKKTERFSPTAFWDEKQWSNGYGTKAKFPTGGKDDDGPKETISESEALSRFNADVSDRASRVASFGKSKKYPWGQNQVDALTSFIYNGGVGWLDQVTKDGTRKNPEIAESMLLYNQAGGKVNSGLQARRAEESAMFKNGMISAAEGGIVNGPMSGYPATLHGNEIISPLSPNSILEQLAKTPAVASAVAANQSNASDILMELHELMETKFNDMINTLKDGNDLTDKLLKYSMV